MAAPMETDQVVSSNESDNEEEVTTNQRKFKVAKYIYTSGANARLIINTFQKKRMRGQLVPDKTKPTTQNKSTNRLKAVIERIESERPGVEYHASSVKVPTSNYYPQAAKDKLTKQIRIYNRKVALDPFREDYKTLLNALSPNDGGKRTSRPIQEEIHIDLENKNYKLTGNHFRFAEQKHDEDTKMAVMVGTKSTLTRSQMFYYFDDYTSTELVFNSTATEVLAIAGDVDVQIQEGDTVELGERESFRIPEKIPFNITAAAGSVFYVTLVNNGVMKGSESWRTYCDNTVFLKESE